ncbi:hypothetical protein KCU81_g4309, partial [Aureobasidium melanogenum]|uniref:C3H1-type domain-containing protein n=1 Tax=Aureobasidium melanogenum (strain CBS 110374) TaxID=1043003 RepID=A0A074VTU2_AURM1
MSDAPPGAQFVPPLEPFPSEPLSTAEAEPSAPQNLDVTTKVERLQVHHITVCAALIKHRRCAGSTSMAEQEPEPYFVFQAHAQPQWTRDQYVAEDDGDTDCVWNDSVASIVGRTCGRTLRPMRCKRQESGTCPFYHVCPDFSKTLGGCPFPSHHGMLVHIRPTCRFVLSGKACPRPLDECRFAHDYAPIRRHREIVSKEEGEYHQALLNGIDQKDIGHPKYWPTPKITEVLYR